MSAPTANQVYSSCMEAAGDLLEGIKAHSRDASFTPDQRALAIRNSSDAVLKLVQTAVTIHAAAKTVPRGKR